MSLMKKFENIFLFLLSLFIHLYVFLVSYLNYDSMRGTDIDKYGPYLNYFLFGGNNDLEEQGVGYFWLIAEISKLKIESILFSSNFVNPVLNFGIHFGNFIFYLVGSLGVFFLLRKLSFSKNIAFLIINMICFFPPLIGARIILKPEIMAYAFIPWCILFLICFFEEKKIIYLYFIVPFLAILLSSKASIALMTALSLLIFFKKELLNKHTVFLIFLTVFSFALLINESFDVNQKYVWEHVTPNGYENTASLDFLLNVNSDLIFDPYRNSQAGSLLGILLLDTFGDYWERYWFHKSAWLGNGNLFSINFVRFGIIISLLFYGFLILNLFKEKNKYLKKIGSLSFVGILVLLITIFNVFPFLTKNFNPSKGDPIKTHYFSFFLVFSLIYILLKLYSSKYRLASFIVSLVLVSFSLQIFNTSSYETLKTDENSVNKLRIVNVCILTKVFDNKLSEYSPWCLNDGLVKSICGESINDQYAPKSNDDYLIFPQDPNFQPKNLVNNNSVVTVGSYFECENYVLGGFVPQETSTYIYGNAVSRPKIFIFNFVILTLIIIFYSFLFFGLIRTTIRPNISILK